MTLKFSREPDWNDFRVFLEVARSGQLTVAAKRMKVDDSTVSRRVAQLELTLDTKLFDRNKMGLALTNDGRKLLRHIEAIESHVLSAREAIRGGAERYVGSVRVAMMEGIGSLFVARHVPKFIDQYPGIRLELVTSPTVISVTRREADIFISFFEPSGRGLWSEKIGEIGLRLYASASYLAAHGCPSCADDLVSHGFIDYIEDLVAIDAIRWLHDVAPHPRIVFHSNSMIAHMSAAASGVGLVVLPCFAGDVDSRLTLIKGSEFVANRGLWISAHHDLHDVPRVKAVIRFLTDLVHKQQSFLKGQSMDGS